MPAYILILCVISMGKEPDIGTKLLKSAQANGWPTYPIQAREP
jgi:hypothetical protein